MWVTHYEYQSTDAYVSNLSGNCDFYIFLKSRQHSLNHNQQWTLYAVNIADVNKYSIVESE